MQGQLGELTETIARETSQWQERKDNNNDEILREQEKLSSTNQNITIATTRLTQLKRDIKDSEGNIAELCKLQSINQELQIVKEQLTARETDVGACEADKKELEDKLEDLRDDLSELKSVIDDLEKYKANNKKLVAIAESLKLTNQAHENIELKRGDPYQMDVETEKHQYSLTLKLLNTGDTEQNMDVGITVIRKDLNGLNPVTYKQRSFVNLRKSPKPDESPSDVLLRLHDDLTLILRVLDTNEPKKGTRGEEAKFSVFVIENKLKVTY